jgi:PAS domain S-box-containing protein
VIAMAASDEPVDILVVDDHPENLRALAGMLSAPAHRIVTVASGAEALRRLLKEEFALILLDVVMPGMDGFETARLIRLREACRHIPIVFLTAQSTDMALIYRGYEVGAVDYLLKPLDPTIVRAKVSVFVDLYRKTKQIRRQEALLREAERRQNAEALRESEAQYEATFREAAVGIGLLSLDGRWVRVNERLGQILGRAGHELLAAHLQDFIATEDLGDTLNVLREILAGRRDADRRERRFVHQSGVPIWVNVSLSLLRDREDRPRQFVAVVEDITARKRDEAIRALLTEASDVLLSSLDHRSTLAQVAKRAVVAVADWCVIHVGASTGEEKDVIVAHRQSAREGVLRDFFLRLHASKEPNEVGPRRSTILLGPSDLVPPGTSKDGEAEMLLAQAGFSSAMVVPLVARGKVLGSLTLASADVSRVYGPADLVVAEDLAQRIAFAVENARLFSDAQEAIRARDEFLSIASHELRTPLTPLLLQLQGLLKETPLSGVQSHVPEWRRNVLKRMERQVQRLGALVDNLLDVARIRAGKLALQEEHVDLSGLVQEVCRRFGDEIARSGCAVSIHTDGVVTGRWDRLRLEQVVTNLIANAVKYGRGKPIEITVGAWSGGGRLTVRDFGIGIPAEMLPRIFERFERAVSSRAYGGLGLGLYIVRQIVEAHGGCIRVMSQPGEGATFVVELPPVAAGVQSGEGDEPNSRVNGA